MAGTNVKAGRLATWRLNPECAGWKGEVRRDKCTGRTVQLYGGIAAVGHGLETDATKSKATVISRRETIPACSVILASDRPLPVQQKDVVWLPSGVDVVSPRIRLSLRLW